MPSAGLDQWQFRPLEQPVYVRQSAEVCQRTRVCRHADADRYNHHHANDNHTQPGNLFRLFNAEQNQRLFDGTAGSPGLTGIATFLRAILVLLSPGRWGEVACCRLTGARHAGMGRSLKLRRRSTLVPLFINN
jgi:hypothetical protein